MATSVAYYTVINIPITTFPFLLIFIFLFASTLRGGRRGSWVIGTLRVKYRLRTIILALHTYYNQRRNITRLIGPRGPTKSIYIFSLPLVSIFDPERQAFTIL
ncbi:hypothetical protein F4809DRAFT_629280 [Biscogniauxia mediterranea]|nr:hypothetical protein F4809DRAFT_629280 [Biscogniauxia mediterranea]